MQEKRVVHASAGRGRVPCFREKGKSMLAKKTTKNQITLPKRVVARFSGVQYFDVTTDGECIILRPLQESRADEVRARLAQLKIDDEDVAAAVAWARKQA